MSTARFITTEYSTAVENQAAVTGRETLGDMHMFSYAILGSLRSHPVRGYSYCGLAY